MVNNKKAHILNNIAINDKTIYLISPVHMAQGDRYSYGYSLPINAYIPVDLWRFG